MRTQGSQAGARSAPRAVPEAPDERLRVSLDSLEERIKLLIARYDELAEEHRALVEAQERLQGGVDPRELDERIRGLESENRRLSRHAAFLETRIRELLSRVRYVVEA